MKLLVFEVRLHDLLSFYATEVQLVELFEHKIVSIHAFETHAVMHDIVSCHVISTFVHWVNRVRHRRLIYVEAVIAFTPIESLVDRLLLVIAIHHSFNLFTKNKHVRIGLINVITLIVVKQVAVPLLTNSWV